MVSTILNKINRPKVGIWGSYNYGNYGDDLMAIMFAEHLRSLNISPCVYRLDKTLAEQYSIDRTDCIEELFQGASFCIIGGGAFLSEEIEYLNHEWKELLQTAENFNCAVHMISVGGDGSAKATKLSVYQKEFLQSKLCQESTVRLPEDVEFLNSLGKLAFYYPDVLLSADKLWNPQSDKDLPKPSQLNIGINLPKSTISILLVNLIKLIAFFRKNVVFHFIHSHLPGYPVNYELTPKESPSNIKTYRYNDPYSALEFISSLDLLISSKLHLGVTALAFGVPFYSVGGASKTRAFLRSINAEFAMSELDILSVLRITKTVSNKVSISQFRALYDFDLIESQKKQSRSHLNEISRLASQYIA